MNSIDLVPVHICGLINIIKSCCPISIGVDLADRQFVIYSKISTVTIKRLRTVSPWTFLVKPKWRLKKFFNPYRMEMDKFSILWQFRNLLRRRKYFGHSLHLSNFIQQSSSINDLLYSKLCFNEVCLSRDCQEILIASCTTKQLFSPVDFL